MQEVISISDYFRFILALGIVIGLILLCAVFLRRIKSANLYFSRNNNRRIEIIDNISIDAKRRLILIKRDDIEHLVILGATSDILIEQNIKPPKILKSDLINNIDDNSINNKSSLIKDKISDSFKSTIKQIKNK